MEGNNFALSHAPDLLIIPTISDISLIMARLEGREKDDNCKFENPDFQLQLKPLYEGDVLRKIYKNLGTRIEYLDAGISVKSTRSQAVELYKKLLEIN